MLKKMPRLILFIILVFLLSCSSKKNEDIKYQVYSAVIENYFQKSKLRVDSVFIALNDSIFDFANEMGILIYSVQNNSTFFDEYFKADTSFKSFILGVTKVDSKVVPFLIDKLNVSHNFVVTINKRFKTPDSPYIFIHFSNVVFSKEFDKAILFVSGGGSGSWYFLKHDKNSWHVVNIITSWVT